MGRSALTDFDAFVPGVRLFFGEPVPGTISLEKRSDAAQDAACVRVRDRWSGRTLARLIFQAATHSMRTRTAQLTAPSLLLLALAASPPIRAQEGGIEVFAAETLFSQGWRISQSYLYKIQDDVYSGATRVHDPQDERIEEHRTVTDIAFGVTPGWTLSGLVPLIYRSRTADRGVGQGSVESSGLGDIAVLSKLRIFKRDWARGSFNLAWIAGVELPTGSTRAEDDGRRLPPRLQVGSGSWDPFSAVSATLDIERFRFDAQLFGKVNTEGSQSFAAGDFLSVELDAAYRFLHTRYPGPTASAKVGVQWRHQERGEVSGRAIGNSGFDEIVLRLGVTVHPVPWLDFVVSLDLPVHRDYRGTQLSRDARAILAIGFHH